MASQTYIDQLAEDFPDIARLTSTFPDLAQLITDAEAGGWSSLQFEQQLWKTNWWITRSESARLWDTAGVNDPGQADRRRDARRAEMETTLARWGATVSATDLADLVEESLRWDYTEQEQSNALASMVGATPTSGGDISANADAITEEARKYMLQITGTESQRLALEIERGHLTLDGLRSSFKQSALASFPQFESYLNKNQTIDDATFNVRNQVANVLELDPASIDFNDDRFLDLIDYDPGTGDRRMMTRAEAGRWARTQPEYRKTEGAQQKAASLKATLLQGMGEVIL
jgi:hypothetical protein